MEHALGNGLDNAVNLACDLRQLPFGHGFIDRVLRSEAVVFFLIGFDELSHQVWMQKLVLEAG
ncbi:hypothetical protein [Shimia sp. MIT1388]|uniref:hypothetical protein n=1 Tax=Shimia sp. MIT1388 TaxID=3096992 RepID=UPI00399BCDFA